MWKLWEKNSISIFLDKFIKSKWWLECIILANKTYRETLWREVKIKQPYLIIKQAKNNASPTQTVSLFKFELLYEKKQLITNLFFLQPFDLLFSASSSFPSHYSYWMKYCGHLIKWDLFEHNFWFQWMLPSLAFGLPSAVIEINCHEKTKFIRNKFRTRFQLSWI